MSSEWALVVALLAVALTACDDSAESSSAKAGPSASQSASASAVADAGVVGPASDDAQPKPTMKNSLVFDSSLIKMDGFTLTHAEAAKHKMSTGAKKYTSMIVHLANYDRGGGSYLPKASKDGQRKVTLNFSSAGDPAVGVYPVDGALGESNKLSVGIHTRDAHVGLARGTGSGEITSIDGSTVSGKVSVRDEVGTKIEATFSVAYESK